MKIVVGEIIGTFVLVFIGCASVAGAVLFGAFNLLQVALIWGVAVYLGIQSSKRFSDSHLNPAVSFALLFNKKYSLKEVSSYVSGQLIGGFLAAIVLYILISNPIRDFEAINHIQRGEYASLMTASIFGEYFPNPGYRDRIEIGPTTAFFAEFLGTGFLVFIILLLNETSRLKAKFKPVLVGLTVSSIILVVAPYTQAGLNPARDLMPRIASYFFGWGDLVFEESNYTALAVYVLAPIAGGILMERSYSLIRKNLF